MDRSLLKFIIRHSLREQIVVTVLTAISLPFLYYSLDLPKTIINTAIQGKNFPQKMFGFEFDQLDYLFLLSGIFLALVFANGGFKYFINVYKGKLGERMLRRLRYELYAQMLRFPFGYFGRHAPGEYIPIITSEVEPLGGFVGDSFAVPALQGGTLITTLGFMCIQDPILGIAAIALYPLQIWLIPKLQRRVNQLTKTRTRMVRAMADRINETALSLHEINAHGTSKYLLSEFSHRLGENYYLRFQIYRLKFFVKFLNNFIAQLTPFFFFLIGGYLVIHDRLSFGALVAVLAAYKDLSPPWRELLDYYQQLQDSKIKYEQVVEQFEPPDMLAPELLYGPLDPAIQSQGDLLGADLAAHNVTFVTDSGWRALDAVPLTVDYRDHVALVGNDNSGKSELATLLCGLCQPLSGRVTLGGTDVATLPRPLIARRIGYVGPTTIFTSASVFDNLVFGLRLQPPAADPRDRRVYEAKVTGNSMDPFEADWIDYEAAGARDAEELNQRILETLEATDLMVDLRELGLYSTLNRERLPEVAEAILKARAALRAPLSAPELEGYFEPFANDRFNNQASVAENLLFGTPVGSTFALEHLSENPYLRSVLDRLGMTDQLVEIGRQTARILVEIFDGLPADHELFQKFSFISANELPEFEEALVRLQRFSPDAMKEADKQAFLSITFRMVPARHRLDVIDDQVRAQILRARHAFAEGLPAECAGAIEFFDVELYNGASPLYDNLLFGRLAPGQQQEGSRVRSLIAETLMAAGLADVVLGAIVEVGLDFQVGIGGSRLSGPLRQKLAIARALLKRPDILILNGAGTQLDLASQNRLIERVVGASRDRTVIWVLQRASLSRHFSRTVVMADGKVVEQGRYDDLNRPDSAFQQQMMLE